MDHDGAWNLFFATGLPQAYLASMESPVDDPPDQENDTGPDPQ